ncbi:hypothetical protein [Teredinibacter sp. KSP-S5-2]|uniref:hypothetical protein n=1 Tax=Teredinibacter sp. KSP-S5-2 TaxID=3034506 RepID=UPI00293458FA|nr:hypothetical protein [Teredinibacter sp. KSP-S5-2]WNO10588.1 hypothetical protein P5V12_05315 [Teredinibacter sp. KSP-S5-2]
MIKIWSGIENDEWEAFDCAMTIMIEEICARRPSFGEGGAKHGCFLDRPLSLRGGGLEAVITLLEEVYEVLFQHSGTAGAKAIDL